MGLQITLITPPDIYENENPSLFFMNLTEQQQSSATSWLAKCTLDIDLNIYYLDKEMNPTWFFHALSSSSHKYINLDNTSPLTDMLAGYILGKSNTCYSTLDKNKSAVYSHINSNKVDNIEDFLERVFSEKR